MIRQKWLSIGGEQYGYPLTDESPCPDGRGRFHHFRAMQLQGRPGASIYWTPQIGAAAVYGGIRAFWAEHNWENSQVGFHSRMNTIAWADRGACNFERELIVWTPQSGASFGALSDGNVVGHPAQWRRRLHQRHTEGSSNRARKGGSSRRGAVTPRMDGDPATA
ncbi:hypothetical protein [Streptomyces sp. NPDC002769]|uniref:LGFP repeat-containing protein n=1 Tax=Streptomyces sp. NPDC002769 TaxID=3154542 RepID=UPI0033311A87